MHKSKTERDFDLIEFTDRYGNECSLQESSLATERCIWFGVDSSNTGLYRMHLTQDQVKELLPHLIHFAKTGNI